jgi:hypothetical protein
MACASIYWCTPLDGSIQCKRKCLFSQLTFEKRKWIVKCYWKTETVTEVQRRWRNEFGVWCWWFTFWTFQKLNAKHYKFICIYVWVKSNQIAYTLFWDTLYVFVCTYLNSVCLLQLSTYSHTFVYIITLKIEFTSWCETVQTTYNTTRSNNPKRLSRHTHIVSETNTVHKHSVGALVRGNERCKGDTTYLYKKMCIWLVTYN